MYKLLKLAEIIIVIFAVSFIAGMISLALDAHIVAALLYICFGSAVGAAFIGIIDIGIGFIQSIKNGADGDFK